MMEVAQQELLFRMLRNALKNSLCLPQIALDLRKYKIINFFFPFNFFFFYFFQIYITKKKDTNNLKQN